MLSDERAVANIFNEEIYKFRELRERLKAAGHHFQGRSGIEVLLRRYLAEGNSALSQLNGIFAFALWNARTQGCYLPA